MYQGKKVGSLFFVLDDLDIQYTMERGEKKNKQEDRFFVCVFYFKVRSPVFVFMVGCVANVFVNC